MPPYPHNEELPPREGLNQRFALRPYRRIRVYMCAAICAIVILALSIGATVSITRHHHDAAKREMLKPSVALNTTTVVVTSTPTPACDPKVDPNQCNVKSAPPKSTDFMISLSKPKPSVKPGPYLTPYVPDFLLHETSRA